MNENEMIQAAADELKKHNQPVVLVMPFGMLFILVAHCQLAFRHPKNEGPGKDLLKAFLEGAVNEWVPAGTSAREIIDQGW